MTIYTQRANRCDEYWTYSDGQRVYLSPAFVARELARHSARLVTVR